MSGLDVAISIITFLFVAIGAWRGFVREALSLVTWIVACVIAWFFADDISSLFANAIDDAALRLVASFLVLFVVVYAIGTFVGFIAHKLVSTKKVLKVSNHILGAFTGIARGVVVIVIAFMLAGLTPAPQNNWWRDSYFAPYFESLTMSVARYLPSDIAKHIRYE